MYKILHINSAIIALLYVFGNSLFLTVNNVIIMGNPGTILGARMSLLEYVILFFLYCFSDDFFDFRSEGICKLSVAFCGQVHEINVIRGCADHLIGIQVMAPCKLCNCLVLLSKAS